MDAPTPLVSVLIPVFNGEHFVAGAIESILAQTFADFELVLIDDGSTDGTASLIERYSADERVRGFRLTENQGIVDALNYGLTVCRGELIARLDADDRCKPTRLELHVQAFERDPELSLHATAYDRIDGNGAPMHIGVPPLTHASLAGDQMSGNRLCHSTVMFRRDLVNTLGGYRREWFTVEDYDLWLRICEAGKFAGCSSFEVTCVESDGGISNTRRDTQAERHRLRYMSEISRLSDRPVTPTSGDRSITRAIAIGRRRQRATLRSRNIDLAGFDVGAYASALRLLKRHPRWKRHAIIMSAAPLLPVRARLDRQRGQRD